MRVMMVHNRYHIRGGEDESTRSEVAMLRAHGHDVLEYVKDNREESDLGGVASALRCIWSRDDYRALRQLIREFTPDVMHVQNFFPLISPAAYYAAAAENVPVVQALRNYRLLCPVSTMLRKGVPCDACIRLRLPVPAVVHGCYRGSRMATAAVATMTTAHRLLGTWSRRIAAYIAISEFMRSVFVSAGFEGKKLAVKPNFVCGDPRIGCGGGGFFLYAGRLSKEKGIAALIEAWGASKIQFGLHIVGDGPMRPDVERFAASDPRVRYLGEASPQDVLGYMGRADAVVVPSIWHEPFGRAVVEAFSKGTPVIASRMGALPELVRNGETGVLYGGPGGMTLAEAMVHFLSSAGWWGQMRQRARAEYEAKYTAEANQAQLLNIYKAVMAES